MNRRKRTFLFLFASTIAYALNGLLGYLLLHNTDLYSFFFLWSIGGALAVPFLMKGFSMRNDLSHGIRKHYLSIAGGGVLVLFNILLFVSFKAYTLALVYPWIALGSLIFFLIDIIMFGRKIGKMDIFIVLVGIVAVFTGVFLADGGMASSFDVALVPIILAIAAFAGIGYYLVFYDIRKYSIGSKVSAMAITSLIASGALFFTVGHVNFGIVKALLIVATGALYVIAVSMELEAVKANEHIALFKDVITRNFINNFTYMDTVLVLIGSVVIGSFAPLEVFGGLLIVIGVVVISLAKREEAWMQRRVS